jgi:hypothetical protein
MMFARQTARVGRFLKRGADDAAQRVLHQLLIPDHVIGHGRPSFIPVQTLTGSFRAVNSSSTGRENINLLNVARRNAGRGEEFAACAHDCAVRRCALRAMREHHARQLAKRLRDKGKSQHRRRSAGEIVPVCRASVDKLGRVT